VDAATGPGIRYLEHAAFAGAQLACFTPMILWRQLPEKHGYNWSFLIGEKKMSCRLEIWVI
jgi:hypothetical protein